MEEFQFNGLTFKQDEFGDFYYLSDFDDARYLANDLSQGTAWFLEALKRGEYVTFE